MRKLNLIIFLFFIGTFALTGCSPKDEPAMKVSGVVEAEEFDVFSQISGEVIAVYKGEGASVKAGELLAGIDSTDAENAVEQAKANVRIAKARLAQLTIKKAEEGGQMPDSALKQLNKQIEEGDAGVDLAKTVLMNAENQLKKYELRAPTAGVVLYQNVKKGQLVNPGSNTFTVQTEGDYWIKVYLPQTYNGKVSLNDKVEIMASNLDGEVISGKVSWISPKAEFTPKNIETTEAKQENTVFAVKIKIEDHLDALRPGMNAAVTFDK